jgi:hypothetical protein
MFSTVSLIDHGASSSVLLCFRGNCWSVQYRYRFRMHDWNLYFVGYLAFSPNAPPSPLPVQIVRERFWTRIRTFLFFFAWMGIKACEFNQIFCANPSSQKSCKALSVSIHIVVRRTRSPPHADTTEPNTINNTNLLKK